MRLHQSIVCSVALFFAAGVFPHPAAGMMIRPQHQQQQQQTRKQPTADLLKHPYLHESSSADNFTTYCQPGDLCWPTTSDISTLRSKLNSSSLRNLNWDGYPAAQTSALPEASDFQQSLYGVGKNATQIEALYVNEEIGHVCFSDYDYPHFNNGSEFCKAATRNYPHHGWTPGFVIFATEPHHVRHGLEFAIKHNLCVMVASTGHEYMNRHSCPSNGVMIRTTAMKQKEFIPDYDSTHLPPASAFPHPSQRQFVSSEHGAFKFGPGLIFSEAHLFAAQNNRVVSSGWCSTVGIIGWSLGGGHGPLAPSLGLGVDNTLEFTVLSVEAGTGSNSSSKVVVERTVNATSNADLFWAMKGGGGSTWGIITSITMKAHPIPATGFTQVNMSVSGTFCYNHGVPIPSSSNTNGSASSSGEDYSNITTRNFPWLNEMIPVYAQWMLTLNEKFATQSRLYPFQGTPGDNCSYTWVFIAQYIYNGPADDPAQVLARESLRALMKPNPRIGDSDGLLIFSNFYEETLQYPPEWFQLYPAPAIPTGTQHPGMQGSVMVSRETVESGEWAAQLPEVLSYCPKDGICRWQFFYQDFTGMLGSPQPNNTALSEGMRSYLFLHITRGLTQQDLENTIYKLSNYTYFSESPYYLPNWGEKYWGAENFQKLREVKKKYDPYEIFWCHHCVGDDPEAAN